MLKITDAVERNGCAKKACLCKISGTVLCANIEIGGAGGSNNYTAAKCQQALFLHTPVCVPFYKDG